MDNINAVVVRIPEYLDTNGLMGFLESYLPPSRGANILLRKIDKFNLIFGAYSDPSGKIIREYIFYRLN